MPTNPPTGYGNTLIIKGHTFTWFNGGTFNLAAYYFGTITQANNATASVKIVPNSQFQKYYGGSAPYGGTTVDYYVMYFNDGINPWLIDYNNPEGHTSCMANISTSGVVHILSPWGTGNNVSPNGTPTPFSEIDPGTLSLLFVTGPVLQFYYTQGARIYGVFYDSHGVNQLQIRDGNWVFYDPTFLPYVAFPVTGVGNSYTCVPSVLPENETVVLLPRLQSGSSPAVGDTVLKTIPGAWDGTTWTDANTETEIVADMEALAGDVDLVKAKTDLINANGIAVTITSPRAADGTIEIFKGDDYMAANGRAIEASFTGTIPDLTGATVQFAAVNKNHRTQPFSPITGTVTSPTSDPVVSFDVPRTVTSTLDASYPDYEYKITATLSNGDVVTLQSGNLVVSQ